MQFENDIKKGYREIKADLKSAFPAAHDFLTSIENLSDRGFHIGTHSNVNLYFNTKFILHIGIDSDSLDLRGKPNGTLKKGTTDDSFFVRFLVGRLSSLDFGTKRKVLEIYNDNTPSCWIKNTSSAAIAFKTVLDCLPEYSDGLDFNNVDILGIVDSLQASNISTDERLLEGIQKTIKATIYERNQKARQACLSHWKYSCFVCGFNFEKTFGELGKNYIHVHHINQISSIKSEYEIDPVKDLRPVCPNCHSMIHRNKEALTIDELKIILAENGR